MIPESSYRHRRVGYPGSGYTFHFVRCKDQATLRDYVREIIKAPHDHIFEAAPEALPFAYSVSRQLPVLPGMIPEAVGTFLCENWLLVVAEQEDPVAERRHWFHECGHICEWAKYSYEAALQAAVAASRENPESGTWYLGYTERAQEFPGYCNELLCEAAESMITGDEAPVKSGFPFLMPWLSKETT